MRPQAAVLIAALLVAGILPVANLTRAAQSGTPMASGIVDVKVETLERGPSQAAPGYTLSLSRLTFAPGGVIALHTHPGDAVFYVASGHVAWTTGQGAPLLTRAGAVGTPTPETLTPGQTTMLGPGDAVFYDGRTSHEVRNDGSEPALVLYSALRASDRPGISFLTATPTP
jgi:quercetin dioxygenase-like cupin family protein